MILSGGGGGGGGLLYKPIRDVPFLRVSFFSLNSEQDIKVDQKFQTGYDYLFKNDRLLFYCFLEI